MIHLLVGMMAEHSVYVGGLRVNVSDKRCLVIITRAIQNAKEHIEQVTGGHTDIVINQYISPEAHLSCRVQNGAAEFAVYHTSPPELISQLNIEDVGLKYFCQAMEFMAKEFSTNDIWKHFRAVQEGHVYRLDYTLFGMSCTFEWPEALRFLQNVLYEGGGETFDTAGANAG